MEPEVACALPGASHRGVAGSLSPSCQVCLREIDVTEAIFPITPPLRELCHNLAPIFCDVILLDGKREEEFPLLGRGPKFSGAQIRSDLLPSMVLPGRTNQGINTKGRVTDAPGRRP